MSYESREVHCTVPQLEVDRATTYRYVLIVKESQLIYARQGDKQNLRDCVKTSTGWIEVINKQFKFDQMSKP